MTRREWQPFKFTKQCSRALANPNTVQRKPCVGLWFATPPADAIPIRHSFSVHSCIHSAQPGSRHCPVRRLQRRRRGFPFPPRAHPGWERSLQKSSGVLQRRASKPRRAKSCTPRSDSRTSSPTCMFPEAHLREILNWVHAGGLKAGVGIPAPRAEMLSYPRRDARTLSRVLTSGLHFRARAIAGTYRVRQLGGPRPEIDHLPPGVHGAAARVASQPEKLDTRAARVCRQRGASAFF